MEVTPGLPVELIVTGDGSHTLHLTGLAENYHSIHGAIAESKHIYLGAGFEYIKPGREGLSILEIGFGTGLNTLLTCIRTLNDGSKIDYTSVDLYPLPEDIYTKLNYHSLIGFQGAADLFTALHKSPWNETTWITENFSLHKLHVSLLDFQPENSRYDLIYFDAFGPEVQPLMWTQEVFNKMASCLKKGGVLATYSTKGMVKRNLKEAGFTIEKLPGPAGKREILRGIMV